MLACLRNAVKGLVPIWQTLVKLEKGDTNAVLPLDPEKSLVLLIIGNSNAANYGQQSYSCRGKVYNYYKGSLYKASDPLPGSGGTGGSVWTRAADRLIQTGLYDKVILIPTAQGSSIVSDWVGVGKYKNKLDKLTISLSDIGIEPSHIVLWFGENENLAGLDPQSIKADYVELIRGLKASYPQSTIDIFISSYHRGRDKILGENETIREVQLSLVNEPNLVFRGVDTDRLQLASDRFDGLHYSDQGLKKISDSFVELIRLQLALKDR